MSELVTLSMKEYKRLRVITEEEAGRVTAREAAEVLGLSVRQTRRLIAAFRKEGAAGLAHGNRGKPSPRRTPESVRKRILELARGEYRDYNDTHFAEKLAERHQIYVSRSTVRRLRRSIRQDSPRKRRPPRHRKRRDRYPLPGMLLQVDGSPHDWLEGRGPKLTLIVAIDDATSELPYALFREQEDAAGYFELMRAISRPHGLPQAVYADRHSIFRNPTEPTIEQELAGKKPRSQFGRLMDELAIELIPSLSPQGRGRVERLFGTLQDRLVKELREANATNIEEANQVLKDYLPRYNARFSVPQSQPGSAYCPWPADLQPEQVFCFKHKRTVGGDNTISFDGYSLPIPPGRYRRGYAHARVDVHQRLDGSLAIRYQGETLVVHQPATKGPVRVGKFTPAIFPQVPLQPPSPQKPIPEATPRKYHHRPALSHPWRRYPAPAKSK